MDEEKKYELEEFVAELEGRRARHTELITVYVSAGYDLNGTIKQLEAEKSTAKNIKSKSTQKNVIDALETLIRQLRLIKRTPKNGLALFAGNVSEKEGQNDFKVWSIEPPIPLNIRLYRCDQQFILEPLKEMLEATEVYGLVVIDRKEATLGVLEGKNIKMLQHMTSGVPGKTEKGGQCLSVDTEVIVNGENKRLANVKVNDIILGYDLEEKGVNETLCTNKWNVKKNKIIKIFFNKEDSIIASEDHLFFVYSDNKLIEKSAGELEKRDKLVSQEGRQLDIEKIEQKEGEIKLIDIETKNHNFIANGILVHNSAARYARIREGLAKEFYRRVADAMKQHFFDMPKLKGIIIGGPVPTKEDFLKEGQLVTKLKEMVLGLKDIGNTDASGLNDLVEASNDLLAQQEIIYEKKLLDKFLESLGKEGKAVYKKADVKRALDAGAVDTLIISKKISRKEIQELVEQARNIAAKIELVSEETEEGQQFKNLGGIGALLRFAIS